MTTTDLPQPGELARDRSRPRRVPASRRRAGQRRARHRRHGAQHRAAAPGDARHVAPGRAARRRARRSRPIPIIGYMHRGYEKLTEYRTYPQITTLINRIDWLSSFANEVPVHRRGREADGHRSAAARRVHPHDPHRAVADRDVPVVPRRDGLAGRRDHARVLRLPRPRVRAQPHRGRHRRPLPPELQPHRRA